MSCCCLNAKCCISSHACRERVGGDRDHWRSRVREGDQGVHGGDPRAGGGPGATTD